MINFVPRVSPRGAWKRGWQMINFRSQGLLPEVQCPVLKLHLILGLSGSFFRVMPKMIFLPEGVQPMSATIGDSGNATKLSRVTQSLVSTLSMADSVLTEAFIAGLTFFRLWLLHIFSLKESSSALIVQTALQVSECEAKCRADRSGSLRSLARRFQTLSAGQLQWTQGRLEKNAKGRDGELIQGSNLSTGQYFTGDRQNEL